MSHPLNFLLLVTMIQYGCSITCHCSNGPQTLSYRTSVKSMIRNSQNTEICANNLCTINSSQLNEVDRKRVNPGCLLITRDNNEVVLQYCMFYMKNFPVGNVPAVVNDLYLWGCQTVGSTHTCICATDFCNQAVQRTTTTSPPTTTTFTTTTTTIPWFTTAVNNTTSAATTSSTSTSTRSSTTTTPRPIDSTTASSTTRTTATTTSTTPRSIDTTTPSSTTRTTTTTTTTTPRPIDTTTPSSTTRTTTTTPTTVTAVASPTKPTSTTVPPTTIKVVTRNWVDAIFTPKPASGCQVALSNILMLVLAIDLVIAR